MERLPLITVVYDRRNVSKHGRSAMLEIRITYNGRQKYLSTGIKVYTGKRGKTGKAFTIPLLPVPLALLSKYGGKLPSISNVKYNLYLKDVARLCGIDKPISSHWARHTGATLLLNKGIGLEIVSRICGHSSVKITEQVYARLLDETVVKAVKEIDK